MARKTLLLCGIFSPLLYALSDILAGMRWEAYSFRDYTISELGAIGAPSRPLFAVLLIPTYLLLVAFGVGVWSAAAGRRRLRVAGGLIVALGVLALAVGQFVPMRPRGTEQGLAGALHIIEGMAAMLILFLAMGLAAAALHRRFRIYTIATLVLILGFGAWTGIMSPGIEAGLPTPWLGVIERVWWYAYQTWFAVLAWTLLREPNRGGPES
jgi:hypothetical membrane protein